jgi:hypothetical protein
MTVTQSNLGQAPEPSPAEVTAAFGGEVAGEFFESIRRAQQRPAWDEDRAGALAGARQQAEAALAAVATPMTPSPRVTLSTLQFTPPNPDFLAILRLYLEKYDALAEEDRALYREVVRMIVNPPIIMTEKESDQ